MTAGVRAASAATFWPQQYFAPYVDTDLGETSLTTLQSEYGTSYFTLAFADGSGCQWSLPDASGPATTPRTSSGGERPRKTQRQPRMIITRLPRPARPRRAAPLSSERTSHTLCPRLERQPY
jgi:hypothetical protein